MGYSNKHLLQDRLQGVNVTGKLRMHAALYDLVELDRPGTKERPRKKGARLPALRSIFNRADTKWNRTWISLYGHETLVLAHRFNAVWYNAARNQPLSMVLVHDPAGKYPDMAFFDTNMGASHVDTIRRYTHRWSAEITNRETKSLLGISDPQG